MTISNRVQRYLMEQQVPFQLVTHAHSQSSIGSAVAAKVPMHKLAKAVVLEDHEGRHMMAILPSDTKVSLARLNEAFHADFHLLSETRVSHLFSDCDEGAVPPFGGLYNMSTVMDDDLFRQDSLFMEAGDHETLIELKQESVHKLFGIGNHTPFSQRLGY